MKASRLSTDEHRRRVEAWWASPNDHKAAQRLQMEYAAFSQWRRLLGLPPREQLQRMLGIPVPRVQGLLDRGKQLQWSLQQLEEDVKDTLKAQARAEERA